MSKINNNNILLIIIFIITLIVIVIFVFKAVNKDKYELKNREHKLKLIESELKKERYNKERYNKERDNKESNNYSLKNYEIFSLKQELKYQKFMTIKANYYSAKYGSTKQLMSQFFTKFIPDYKKTLYNGVSLGEWSFMQDALDSLGISKGTVDSLTSYHDKVKEADKSVGDLLGALYEGFKDGFGSDQSKDDLFKAGGIAALNICLACAGLGFLIGPADDVVSKLFGWEKKKPPTMTIEDAIKILKDYIDQKFDQQSLLDVVGHLENSLNNISGGEDFTKDGFVQEYITKKRTLHTSCETTNPCPNTNNDNPPTCDLEYVKVEIKNCMIKTGYQTYDPNSVLPSTNISKRQELSDMLLTSPLHDLVISPAYHNGMKAIADLYPLNIGGASALFPSFNLIILNTILYHQELSFVSTEMNEKYGIYDKAFINPYLHSQIGNPDTITQTIDNPQKIQPQPGDTLLGKLQSYFNYKEDPGFRDGYLGYIYKICDLYIKSIDTNDPRKKCCDLPDWIHMSRETFNECCIDKNSDIIIRTCRPGGWAPCQKWIKFKDTSGLFLKEYKDTKKTWYSFMQEKHNDTNYAQELEISCDDDSQKTITLLPYFKKYLMYFYESLEFPFQVFLKFSKQAGYILSKDDGTPVTEEDLLNNLMVKILASYGNTDTIIKINQKRDPSGGYPFGPDSPSYREGIMATLAPQSPISPPSGEFNLEDIKKINYFNTFSSPLVAITPNQNIDPKDLAPFINGGDPNSVYYTESNIKCSDPYADSIKSSLLPGASPGIDGGINPNSRAAYCYNSQTKNPSKLIKFGPVKPPISGFKQWTIYAEGQFRAMILQLDSSGNYKFNGYDIPTSQISWDGSTMNLSYDEYFVFDINDNIVGGRLEGKLLNLPYRVSNV